MKHLCIDGQRIGRIPDAIAFEKKEKVLKIEYPQLVEVSEIDNRFIYLHLSVSPATIKIDSILGEDTISMNIKDPEFTQFILKLDEYRWIITGYFMSTDKPHLLVVYKKEKNNG